MDKKDSFLFNNWPQFYNCVDHILGKKTLLENEHIKFLYDCKRSSLGMCCRSGHEKREECTEYYLNLLPTLKEDADFILKLKDATGYDSLSFVGQGKTYHF